MDGVFTTIAMFHVLHPFGSFVGVLAYTAEQKPEILALSAWGSKATITRITNVQAVEYIRDGETIITC